MAKLAFQIYVSYSQLCVFRSSLAQPFNDWSDRNYSQGFAWRDGSVSFRALLEEGEHHANLFINEPVPELGSNVVRAFKVPFETPDGNIEIASISDSAPLEIRAGKYSLQVEFLEIAENKLPELNIRLNKGSCGFEILRADDELQVNGDLDLKE
jgi:hypothetical protein